jgi:hypothetical protein
MRRVVLVLALMAATLVAASGMAMAVNKIGTNGPDTLKGTDGADNLLGRGGNDVLFGFGGRDNLFGEDGKDWVLGGNERRPLGGDKDLVGGSGNDAVLGGTGPTNNSVVRATTSSTATPALTRYRARVAPTTCSTERSGVELRTP